MSRQLVAGDRVVGRFLIKRLLGRGGYGEVYLAEQLSVGRDVALKVLHGDLCDDPLVMERFDLEARRTSQLGHANTVVIHDFGWDDELGLLFLAMEYLSGACLKDVLRVEGPLGAARALSILEQIAGSLTEAHDQGVVHRDLKPANVMLVKRGQSDDVVKVIDFGIAKVISGEGDERRRKLTAAGVVLGTPHFMAPELLGDGKIDQRVDIYALGVMAFQMLTGVLPFEGSTPIEVLKKHVLEPVPRVADVAPTVSLPATIDAWLQTVMAKDPAARPQDMRAFVASMRRCLVADEGPTMGIHCEPVVPLLRVGKGPLQAHTAGTATRNPTFAHGNANADGDDHTAAMRLGRPQGLVIAVAAAFLLAAGGIVWALSLRSAESAAEQGPTNSEAAARPVASNESEPASPDPKSEEQTSETAAPIVVAMPNDLADVPVNNGAVEAPSGPDEVEPAIPRANRLLEGPNEKGQVMDEKPIVPDESASPVEEPKAEPVKVEKNPKSDEKTSGRRDEGVGKKKTVSCKVTAQPWGDIVYKGKALDKRGQTAYIDLDVGKKVNVEMMQSGVLVAEREFTVTDPCQITLRAK